MPGRYDDPVAVEAPIRFGDSFLAEFPWASKSATESLVNVVRTSDLLLQRVAAITREFGLSTAGSNVLGILEGAGEPLSPGVIGQRLFTTPATVTGLIDSLEKRGLVRRIPHPSDRRKLLVEISDAGRELFAQIRPKVHAGEKEWLSTLTPDEQETLIQLVGRVQQHLYRLPA